MNPVNALDLRCIISMSNTTLEPPRMPAGSCCSANVHTHAQSTSVACVLFVSAQNFTTWHIVCHSDSRKCVFELSWIPVLVCS